MLAELNSKIFLKLVTGLMNKRMVVGLRGWQHSKCLKDSGINPRVSEFECKAGATDRFLRLSLEISGQCRAR